MPNTGTYPFGPPAASGTDVTVDVLLSRPTVMQRRILDIATQRFFVDKAFAIGGNVEGGAVQVELPPSISTDLWLNRDVQRIEPGDEYPWVDADRGTPSIFAVEKWGGRFKVTDEARDRNDIIALNRKTAQLANTLRRKMHIRGIEVIEKLATDYSRTLAGVSFSAAAALTFSTKTDAAAPLATLAEAQELFDLDERGYDQMSTLILHPSQKSDLVKTLGATKWKSAIGEFGITDVFSTPRVTAGTGYVLAGPVGGIRFERELFTKIIRDEDNDQSKVQSGTRFVIYGDEPYALLKLTGLA